MEAVLKESYGQPAQPFVDGFGERRAVLDGRGDRLDVFRLNAALTANPSFEAAVRERATRLAEFGHESYSRVRAIETDRSTSNLLIISEHVRGARLSTLLSAAERRSVPIEIPAAACLIRQLVRAAAAWNERIPDVVHGAIGPERIMITPVGRLVILEHVLGSAVEQLRYSRPRYWEELGVPLPAKFDLTIDARADVFQIGVVAVALLRGRRLKSTDRPDEIQPDPGNRLPTPLRTWLMRALQLDPFGSFASAIDARAALDEAFGEATPAEQDGLLLFMARCLALDTQVSSFGGEHSGSDGDSDDPTPNTDDMPDVELGTRIEALRAFLERRSSRAAAAPSRASGGPDQPRPSTGVSAQTESPAPAAPNGQPSGQPPPESSRDATRPNGADRRFAGLSAKPDDSALDAFAPGTSALDLPPAEPTPLVVSQPERERRPATISALPADWTRPLWIAAAAALVVVAALVAFIAGVFPGSSGEASTGSLSIETRPAGIAVTIDGAPRGVTPLAIDLTAGDHLIELITNTEHRRIPVTIRSGSQVSQFLEMGGAALAATATELRVRTEPLGASVTVDGRLVGQSPVSVTDLSPGSHTVMLQHAAGSATEQVLLEAGKTASLFVPLAPRTSTAPTAGWIAVKAPANVQLFENGRFLGSNQIERIMMPAGRHQLSLVNEALGYQEQRTVTVTPGQTAVINATWPTGSLAINAVPWAEAFVNGASVGETPIGNIQVPIGSHEIVFRHPQLGEHRRSVVVTTREIAKVGIDLRAK
jgi:hypothetical protein